MVRGVDCSGNQAQSGEYQVKVQTKTYLPLIRRLGKPLGDAAGASTSTIAYQGRLTDMASAPLTGTYGMIFHLHTGATGGTPLWSEQWSGAQWGD